MSRTAGVRPGGTDGRRGRSPHPGDPGAGDAPDRLALAPDEAVEPPRDPVLAGERAVARLLEWGVGLAALLLLAGFAGATLRGEPLSGGVMPLGRALSGKGGGFAALAQLGLLLLATTPLARVALAAGVFARAGEKRLAWVAVAVLALLALGVLVGGLA